MLRIPAFGIGKVYPGVERSPHLDRIAKTFLFDMISIRWYGIYDRTQHEI